MSMQQKFLEIIKRKWSFTRHEYSFADYNSVLRPSLVVSLGANDDAAILSSRTNLYFKNTKSHLGMNKISTRSPFDRFDSEGNLLRNAV